VEFVPIAIGTPPVLKEKLLLPEELFYFQYLVAKR
jgi:hypothetical protein